MISVIIPAYNAARYVTEALRSVSVQSSPCEEILVVDDGSTDETRQVVKKLHEKAVRLVLAEHQGVSAARNLGVKEAQGDLLAFLDADDLWEKDKLRIQQQILTEQPELDGVFGHVTQFVSPELSLEQSKKFSVLPGPMPGYHAGCLLIKRTSFLEVGGFREELQSGEFIDWFIRAKERGLRFFMPDQVLMHRRIHGENSVLKNKEQLYRDYFQIIRLHQKAAIKPEARDDDTSI